MKINESQADQLCQDIVNDLHSWPSLMAALQEGGFEAKTDGRIEMVVDNWQNRLNGNGQFGVLRDVKLPGSSRDRMDLVIYDKNSVGNPLLAIDAIFEIKTNYARQVSEIQDRLGPGSRSAIAQLQRYLRCPQLVSANNLCGYIIYTVTELPFQSIPKVSPRSPGFGNGYFPLKNGVAALIGVAGANLLGECCGRYVYCALIKV